MSFDELRRRVDAVFARRGVGDDKDELFWNYAKWLRENIVDINNKLYKTAHTIIILLIISIFFLFYDVHKIKLNFIETDNIEIIIKILPAIISYFYMVYADKAIYDLFIGTFSALLIHSKYVDIYKHRLHLFAAPYSVYYVDQIVGAHVSSDKNRKISFINKIIGFLVFGTPVLILLELIKILFSYNIDMIMVVSIIFSGMFCYHGVLNVLRSMNFSKQASEMYSKLDD